MCKLLFNFLKNNSCIVLTSCTTGSSSGSRQVRRERQLLHGLEWLIGRWENRSGEGTLSEIWRRENDSVFVGVSYFVIGEDTVFREKIRLESQGGNVYYKPEVDGQNEGKPVVFTETFNNGVKWVFENPQHDYPQTITYMHRQDSLIAVIAGKKNGKPGSEQFALKRIRPQ